MNQEIDPKHSPDRPLVLIVEDEPKLAQLLSDYLTQADYQSHCIYNGLEVLPWVKQHPVSLILLDIMLPGRDGMSICRDIRESSDVPIIMVTARVEEIDRLLGLELGADDYICKPYSPREVVARVKAVLRRTQAPSTKIGKNQPFQLDEDTYRASYAGQPLTLTALEFRLLSIFVNNPYKVFSREQLLARIYSDQRVVSERTIDTHIKNLRKKLNVITPEIEVIRSIYSVGYKLEI